MLHKLLALDKAMPARDHTESHRSATTLELFYDLVIVISIAFAATNLHHAIIENHILDGVITFVMVFWAIWWAWMTFTWFASSYDNDDAPYRIAIFVQLIGSLILAAGIDQVFENHDFRLATIGYVVMRLALVALWLRVMKSNPQDKAGAIRYALGICLCQIGWIVLVFFMSKDYLMIGFFVLLMCEHFIPYYADGKKKTRWHREHIIERYGLLTIIVLGEALLASTIAMKALTEHYDFMLVTALIGGLLILFSMWWLYFEEQEHPNLDYSPKAYLWGYGHCFIFISIAAVGAGLAAVTDQVTNEAVKVSSDLVSASVAVPCAIFLLSMWLVHDIASTRGLASKFLYPLVAVFILLMPLVPYSILAIGIVLLVTVLVRVRQPNNS